ncbi:MAG: hypothetical protein M9921_10380 [Fimbriimonadaceae bacterium]|nr:hypothetical protein [Chthonomonadaceae bacterium]MCO5297251.1 hypothetical protein [Fimbriimonadaceae bacterium]
MTHVLAFLIALLIAHQGACVERLGLAAEPRFVEVGHRAESAPLQPQGLSNAAYEELRTRRPCAGAYTLTYNVVVDAYDPSDKVAPQHPKSTASYSVVLAIDGRRVSYVAKAGQPARMPEVCVYYNGIRTYAFLGGHLTVHTGKQLGGIQHPPLFGTSILGSPLFQANANPELYEKLHLPPGPHRADVYYQPGNLDPPSYLVGFVKATEGPSGPRLSALYAVSPTQPLQSIAFEYTRTWAGFAPMASKTVVTMFRHDDPNSMPTNLKLRSESYSLEQASKAYQGYSIKDVLSRMHAGDTFEVVDEAGHASSLPFVPGSLGIKELFADPPIRPEAVEE